MNIFKQSDQVYVKFDDITLIVADNIYEKTQVGYLEHEDTDRNIQGFAYKIGDAVFFNEVAQNAPMNIHYGYLSPFFEVWKDGERREIAVVQYGDCIKVNLRRFGGLPSVYLTRGAESAMFRFFGFDIVEPPEFVSVPTEWIQHLDRSKIKDFIYLSAESPELYDKLMTNTFNEYERVKIKH